MAELSPRRGLTMPLAWLAATVLFLIPSLAPAVAPTDYSQHDLYYVVPHYHYLLSFGTLLVVFAGAYLLLDVILRAPYPRYLAWTHFGLTCVGVGLLIAPSVFIPLQLNSGSILGDDLPEALDAWNALASVAYGSVVLGLVAFTAVVVTAFRARRRTT